MTTCKSGNVHIEGFTSAFPWFMSVDLQQDADALCLIVVGLDEMHGKLHMN